MKLYKAGDICTVIVSYNPDRVLEENVRSILSQTGTCLIVDNGSEKTAFLERVENDRPVHVIRLRENKGIAAALNVGLQYCLDYAFPLMLTMDQDTVLNVDAVSEMLDCINHENVDSVGINWDGKAEKDEGARFLITSGNLVKTEAAEKIGGYDEKLFIDSVDFDFSLRLTENGYRLLKSAKAGAVHRLGEQQHSGYVTHSPERYYYIFRNHFYLIGKYRKKHRLFCVKKQLALGYDLVKILLFDQEKKAKFAMLAKGYRDYRKMNSGI